MGQLGWSGTAWTVGVSPLKVGRTGKTKVQSVEGVGGTQVLGSGTAETGVVAEEEVGRPDKTGVQTLVGVSVTEVGGIKT